MANHDSVTARSGSYPPEGYPKDAYPPPGYPAQGYPQQGYPPQGYPPQYAPPQYAQPPPQQQQNQSSGLMEGWRTCYPHEHMLLICFGYGCKGAGSALCQIIKLEAASTSGPQGFGCSVLLLPTRSLLLRDITMESNTNGDFDGLKIVVIWTQIIS
ncbi:hypothetical protein Cgig2_014641 [Carnegiea gigantea]|uniref:Rhodopsin n=1 Tax=Carnegiea gigantea TaxID=171969 RepID=A0A9Q1QRN7_9CARY|nr:hypothetical protein Cgig2_014641 [Carnegiea gigantea]